jgi:hypothetical protein
MFISSPRKILRPLTGLMFVLLLSGLCLSGCGGDENPPDPALPKEAPADTAAPAETPEAAVPVQKALPGTVAVSGMIPPEAQLSLAVPSLNAVLAKAAAVDQYMPEAGAQEQLVGMAQMLSMMTGGQGSDSLAEVAQTNGLDPDSPIAFFADVSTAIPEVIPPAEPEGEAAEGDAPDTQPTVGEPGEPSGCIVIPILDQEKAQALLKIITTMNSDPAQMESTQETVADQTITVMDDYGYFFADSKLVMGSPTLVRSMATHWGNSLESRYGTEACPILEADEIALQVYPGRMKPFLEQGAALAAMTGTPEALASVQMGLLKALLGDNPDEAVVTTLSWVDDRLHMLCRLDTKAFPAIVTDYGAPRALQLPQLLPANTVAFLSILLTDEYKKQISENMLPAAADGATDPGTAMGVGMAGEVVKTLGNEVTIGIGAAEEDIPALFVMIDLVDPEGTLALLAMAAAPVPTETYKEIEISALEHPMAAMMPTYLATLGNTALLTTNLDKMKAIIDLRADGKTSGLFAGLNPPLDAATPRYSALVLKPELMDALLPMAAFIGTDPAEAQAISTQVATVLREVRAVKEMQGSWVHGDLSVFFREGIQ